LMRFQRPKKPTNWNSCFGRKTIRITQTHAGSWGFFRHRAIEVERGVHREVRGRFGQIGLPVHPVKARRAPCRAKGVDHRRPRVSVPFTFNGLRPTDEVMCPYRIPVGCTPRAGPPSPRLPLTNALGASASRRDVDVSSTVARAEEAHFGATAPLGDTTPLSPPAFRGAAKTPGAGRARTP